ncbi:RING finger protein 37 isoform X1 [Anguilla rostrata]|uniref:RING finger protein 37 isoform X1 n=2 Tax=Anguilla rostrata TaxID=7938 RepID=UPI0030D4CD5C
MVVNLCLPHFETSVHCNKLSADGYDVTNLLSGDPSVRGRGFKLEYFLRPPVQVTLRFPVQVEVCRVDVELWPPGMDLGQAARGLEVLTSSAAQDGGQFLLVGRCKVKDEVSVIFSGPRPRPRPPFPPAPPDAPPGALGVELWSRGPRSLGVVTQLRVSLPYGGAGSPLGLRALAVWGRPAHCCPPLEVERIARAHTDSLKVSQHESRSATPCPESLPTPDPPGAKPPNDTPVPEEFLDPLTQELMSLPMLLPSGAVIDSSTLETYQRQEATWGRPPNDPFTGVPFCRDAQPLPCPLLKGRIDLFLLRGGGGAGGGATEGRLGRAVQQEQPRPSRLADHPSSLTGAPPAPDPSHPRISGDTPSPPPVGQDRGVQGGGSDPVRGQVKLSAPDRGVASASGTAGSILSRKRPLEVQGRGGRSSGTGGAPPPSDSWTTAKKVRKDTPPQPDSCSSSSSHEQRLADSLDQALSSALRNLPAFTAHQAGKSCATESQGGGTNTGESRCALCACPLSQYPSCPPAFRLPCGHLLCRPCLSLQAPSKPPRPPLLCPACRAPAPSSSITRVHF